MIGRNWAADLERLLKLRAIPFGMNRHSPIPGGFRHHGLEDRPSSRWGGGAVHGLRRSAQFRIVRLTSVEQKSLGGTRDHTAAAAFRHWFVASARKIRSVERDTRWR